MGKVFLGGTCNGTTCRDELIKDLKIDYFNPVVEDWTEDCQKVEENEKANECNIHFYMITSDMTGVFSIAEAVDSVHDKAKTTILHINPDGFGKHELKSLKAVSDLINRRGGISGFVSSQMKYSADLLNDIKI